MVFHQVIPALIFINHSHIMRDMFVSDHFEV